MQYDKETENLINDLSEQIKLAQSKIDKLKSGKSNNVRWRAAKGDNYYSCSVNGSAISCKDIRDTCDNFKYEIGNYFPTMEEAEKYKQNLIITQKLKDIALRLNNGIEIDWENEKREKFAIVRHHSNYQNKLELTIENFYELQCQGTIYCLSDKFLETAIKEIGEKELIKYIRGC